jgi:xylan 1,4-beta-xylosidase
VEKDGRNYLLYHAYHAEGAVYAGRQGVLKEFRFTDDGWIALVDDSLEPVKPEKFSDAFSGKSLSPEWQWSVFTPAKYTIKKGSIQLMGTGSDDVSFLGQKTLTANYTSQVTLNRKSSDAAGGLAIVGDEKNLISLVVDKERAYILKLQNGKREILNETRLPDSNTLVLNVSVNEGHEIIFSYEDGNKKLVQVNKDPVDGAYLPPWDRALRVAITATGGKDQKVVFDNFSLQDK